MDQRITGSPLICLLTLGLSVLAVTIAPFGTHTTFAADVTLAWDANAEPDIAGYKIYYDTSPGAPYYGTDADQGTSPLTVLIEDLNDPNNPEFTLTGLDDYEDYYFALKAFNDTNAESGYSNEVCNAAAAGGASSGGGSTGDTSGGSSSGGSSGGSSSGGASSAGSSGGKSGGTSSGVSSGGSSSWGGSSGVSSSGTSSGGSTSSSGSSRNRSSGGGGGGGGG